MFLSWSTSESGGGGGGVCVCVCPNEKPKPVADPGFPRGSTDIKWRHQPIIKEYRTTVMRPKFPENCMEMRLIGGACLKFVYHWDIYINEVQVSEHDYDNNDDIQTGSLGILQAADTCTYLIYFDWYFLIKQ